MLTELKASTDGDPHETLVLTATAIGFVFGLVAVFILVHYVECRRETQELNKIQKNCQFSFASLFAQQKENKIETSTISYKVYTNEVIIKQEKNSDFL